MRLIRRRGDVKVSIGLTAVSTWNYWCLLCLSVSGMCALRIALLIMCFYCASSERIK